MVTVFVRVATNSTVFNWFIFLMAATFISLMLIYSGYVMNE